KCKDHSCYKGSGGVAGCPMFNHVMFVDSNQHCVLCMNCIRSCPSRSPQLNLRPPARELWHDPGVQPVPALFVAASLGLVAGLALLQDWERQGEVLGSLLLAHHRFPFVSAALALSAALPMVAVGPALRRSWKARQDAAACGLWNRIAAWTPLMAAGFASYQLGYGLGLPGLQATLTYGGRGEGLAPAVSFSVLALVRFVLLSAGLVVTAVILWKLEQDQRAGDERKASWTGTWVVSLAGPVLYWAVVQVLMLRPDWLTG
ncbi:MAG: hypothetical protein HY321_02385, partial [Armatimonadetes bacterium]|nr:hypothetical protein [Armatimonadota bacterium]